MYLQLRIFDYQKGLYLLVYIWYQGNRYEVKGVQDKGKRIALQERLPIPVSKIEKSIHTNG